MGNCINCNEKRAKKGAFCSGACRHEHRSGIAADMCQHCGEKKARAHSNSTRMFGDKGSMHCSRTCEIKANRRI